MEKRTSKFESVRIIAARALQISQGAPILIKIPKGMSDPTEIAKLEYEEGLVPIEARKRAI